MRSRAYLFALLLTAGALAVPLVAEAAIPFFGPIIPTASNKCAASFGMLMIVINNIISLLITLAIVFVAPLMIAWSGFLFVVNPVNAGGISQAKSILTNTVVGIVIALAGWLIVDALMAVLYNPQAVGKTWSTLVAGNSSDLCIKLAGSLNQSPSGGLITGASATGTVAVVPPSAAPASETAIRQQLASAGIQINRSPCSPYDANGVVSRCTNVGGMLSSTVSQVIGIKNSCNGCTVMVTGGSEAGHAAGAQSHGAGYKVDLGLNSSLNTFLQKLPLTGQRGGDSGGPIRKDSCGNEYVQESTHWDIKVLGTCSL
jgi:hypothetical protein